MDHHWLNHNYVVMPNFCLILVWYIHFSPWYRDSSPELYTQDCVLSCYVAVVTMTILADGTGAALLLYTSGTPVSASTTSKGSKRAPVVVVAETVVTEEKCGFIIFFFPKFEPKIK